MRDAWAGLENGDEEILVGPIKENFSHLDDERKVIFDRFVNHPRDDD